MRLSITIGRKVLRVPNHRIIIVKLYTPAGPIAVATGPTRPINSGLVRTVIKFRPAKKDIITGNDLIRRAALAAFGSKKGVSVACKCGIIKRYLKTAIKTHVKDGAAGPAVIKARRSPGNGIIVKIGAVTDKKRIFHHQRTVRFNLVAGVAFGAKTLDGDRPIAVMIQKIDPIGYVVADVAVIKDPISAGMMGS